MKAFYGLTIWKVYLNHTKDEQKIIAHMTDGTTKAFAGWYYDNALDFFDKNKFCRCNITESAETLHIFMQ